MSSNRQVKCPLCQTPENPKYLAPGGICFSCNDARRDNKREHFTKSLEREKAAIELASSVEKRLTEVQADLIKEKKAAEAKKVKKEKTKQLNNIQKEQASLSLARKSLLHYIERRKPNYKINWFIEDVARRIEKFFEDVNNERSPRLILTISSRHGKSELASDSGPAWYLGNNPDKSVVIASYSDDLPTKFSKSIRAQLQSPDYKKIFPNGARVSKTDSAAGAWMTDHGGGLKAVGCGGGLLGFGAHAMIMDDIIRSAEDADNPATLESAYDWMTSTAMSRLYPGGGMMLIMQRLAPLDPVGRIHISQKEEERRLEEMLEEIAELNDKTAADIAELESLRTEAKELDESMDRWETIIYPALATYDEYLTPEGDIVRVADNREVQPGWRQLRKPGDALHPDRYSRNALLKLQRANPARFQSMYMLDPIAEAGEYFLATDFNRYAAGKHPKLETLHVFCAWDLAISTKTHADYTVGVAGGIDHQGQIWFLEMTRGRFGDLSLVSDLIIDLHTRWGATMTGIEKTAMELSLSHVLSGRMKDRREFIALAEGKSALKPISDKRMRARTLQGSAKQGKVYVPQGELWDSFIAEASTFPVGGHDDMVDAASWLAIMLTREGLPRDPAVVAQSAAENRPVGYDPYEDEFNKLADDVERITYMEC